MICLARNPDLRVRDVAQRVGITERAAQPGPVGLAGAVDVLRARSGRRNSYRLDLDRPLRHPLESPRPVRDLVRALASETGTHDSG